MNQKEISVSNTENPNTPHPFVMELINGQWEITKVYINGIFVTPKEAKELKPKITGYPVDRIERNAEGKIVKINKYINGKWIETKI